MTRGTGRLEPLSRPGKDLINDQILNCATCPSTRVDPSTHSFKGKGKVELFCEYVSVYVFHQSNWTKNQVHNGYILGLYKGPLHQPGNSGLSKIIPISLDPTNLNIIFTTVFSFCVSSHYAEERKHIHCGYIYSGYIKLVVSTYQP